MGKRGRWGWLGGVEGEETMVRMYYVREGSFQLKKKGRKPMDLLFGENCKEEKERGREEEGNELTFALFEFSIPQATVQGRKEGGELGIHSEEQLGHHFPPQSCYSRVSTWCVRGHRVWVVLST